MSYDKELLDIYKHYQRIYPELKGVKLVLNKSCRIDGCEGKCYIEPFGNYVTEGKRRYRLIKVYKIKVNKDISEQRKKFALLHEMAHAITPLYERKFKDEWVIPHDGHDHEFYLSFLKIINEAFDNKFYNKKMSLKQLRIEDRK